MNRVIAAENYIQTGHRQLQGNAYYASEEVYGNVVRKPQQSPYKRLRSSREILRRSKALRRQKAVFIVLGTIASVIVVSLCVLLLKSIETNQYLSDQVSAKETEYENMVLNNDSREYEISSSVDLNYVITAATQELGMVRSNASQIVTYSIKNSEYLQQVAQVPLE